MSGHCDSPVLSDRSRISPFRSGGSIRTDLSISSHGRRVRTIRALLAFWAALHARARLLLTAALRVHSVGRFVRALTFRFARPVVRLDEGRSHHFWLSRLSRSRDGGLELSLLLVGHLSRRLLGFGKEVLRFLYLEKKLSPLLAHSPRHRAPSSFRSVHRPPSGVRARSSYGQSFAAAFHLRAAPYCGRLSLSASWGAFAPRRSLAKPHDHLAALAMSCACSPRHSHTTLRDLLSDLTSGRTCSRSLSFRSSNMPASWGGHARSPFEQSTQTRSPFGGSLARGHDAPFEARA